jgi:hypothetical protein
MWKNTFSFMGVFSQAKNTLEIWRNTFLHLYVENGTKSLLPPCSQIGTLGLYSNH